MLGKREGFGHKMMAPHSLALTMVGTGMLWVGWYGFNAGSAVAADGIAANAFMTTTLSAAVAGFTWPLLEWITRGKPTVLGFCSGIVAGSGCDYSSRWICQCIWSGHHRSVGGCGSFPGLYQAQEHAEL